MNYKNKASAIFCKKVLPKAPDFDSSVLCNYPDCIKIFYSNGYMTVNYYLLTIYKCFVNLKFKIKSVTVIENENFLFTKCENCSTITRTICWEVRI